MNLAEYVTPDKHFDKTNFAYDVKTAVIGLNEVLDEGLPLHPLEEQRESVAKWRQIGLGIMGLADMLIKMEIPYDSDEAISLCDRIGLVMINAAIEQSAYLAQEKGPYKGYSSKELNTNFYLQNCDFTTKTAVECFGLRNSQVLTTAPTGSISTMLGISGGLEPIFATHYTRKTESLHGKDVYYKVYTPIVQEYMDAHGLTDESQLPNWFVTAQTIDPFKRVEMQSAWQKHIDASISSTVNLPESATVEEIEELYIEAWKKGLKGLTIFRSGCKRQGILTSDKKEENVATEETKHSSLERGDIINCADNLVGKKRKIQTGCGPTHILAYFDPDTADLMEVYLNKGSEGGCALYMTGLSRMISLACRAGVDIMTIKDQLDSTGSCPSYAVRRATKHDTSKGSCCPMAVGNALVDMWKEMREDIGLDWQDDDSKEDEPVVIRKPEPIQKSPEPNELHYNSDAICPECGEPLVFEGGCNSCKNCGYSKCN